MAIWPQPVAIDWAIEYAKLRALWRRSPVLYAKQRLGLNPTWQQAQLLKAIAEPEARVLGEKRTLHRQERGDGRRDMVEA